MPELPDIELYLEHLRTRLSGQELQRIRLASPFVLRSVDPPLKESFGKRVRGFHRIGKRIVFELEMDLFLVVHLMISGRFRWRPSGAPIVKKLGLAAFDFAPGTLLFTEASSKKRASLHLVRGAPALEAFRRGGIEPLTSSRADWERVLASENHTLKRSLTDPRLFSGIGNAYSDEILHRARMSPVKRTFDLNTDEIERLRAAAVATLEEWTRRLREENGPEFPEKVTAFRQGMAVHGRYKEPCPVCQTLVQRIRYADNEMNYCPRCQTGGKLLADRSLSRLLRGDWPKSIDELEERIEARGKGSSTLKT